MGPKTEENRKKLKEHLQEMNGKYVYNRRDGGRQRKR
jgi:hypothetical protein